MLASAGASTDEWASNSVTKEGENEEEPQINEELYTSIMDSIERVWLNFDQDEGLLSKVEFQDIMIKIATD